MSEKSPDTSYKTYLRLLSVAVFMVIGIWFAVQIVSILFLFFFAVVLTLILNAPAIWLVRKGMSRTVAALVVFFIMLIFLGVIAWLVIPRILEQISTLIANLPLLIRQLQQQVLLLVEDYPSLREQVVESTSLSTNLPSAAALLGSVTSLSLSLLGIVVLLIIFFSLVIYMLIDPRPLIETYLFFFSDEKRPKAARALSRASTMMVGWMWSNLLVGTMEAIAVFVFLSYMDVPGVWIWAALALFAEMVPRLGMYIMMIPPTLIALSIHPSTALWVLIFYLVLNEIMGDFVMPRVRASTMNLHPVSSLFVMLVLASAFGLIGALVATPFTAFIKAYYEEFFLSGINRAKVKEQVDMVMNRRE